MYLSKQLFSITILHQFLTISLLNSYFQTESNRHSSILIQTQTIVTLSKLVTAQAIHQCLKFIYSSAFDVDCSNLKVSKDFL